MKLTEALAAIERLGGKGTHVRAIARHWLCIVPYVPDDAHRLPTALEADLAHWLSLCQNTLALLQTQRSADTVKALFALEDSRTIETVLLPRDGVCVSTQVGCAVGCAFCMTGKGGLIRHLDALEIIAQVAWARSLNPRLVRVVFMGMGEPSHNLQNVLMAIDFLAEHGQYRHKNLVLSTVGDARVFDALSSRTVKPALAVSLHSMRDATRQALIAHPPKLPVREILERAGGYARLSGYPVQYEWTLIEGVNDGFDEIDALAQILKTQYAMVNFIPVNPVPGSPFRRPSEEHQKAIIARLRSQGCIATIRQSAGQDILGGCGQLRSRVLSQEGKAP